MIRIGNAERHPAESQGDEQGADPRTSKPPDQDDKADDEACDDFHNLG
jgi:hypothetical protein